MMANGEYKDYLKLKERLAKSATDDDEPLKDYADVIESAHEL